MPSLTPLRTLARHLYRAAHPRGVRRTINGMPVRVSTTVARGLPRTIESDVLPQWLAAVAPSTLVFDVGANIGVWSVLAARHMPRGGRCVAIEPSAAAFSVVQDMARVAGGPGVIVPLHAAVGQTSGTAHLAVDAPLAATNRLATAGVSVPMRTLDELAQTFGVPDVVKLDIEGAELLALEGFERTLASHRTLVLVELHWGTALGLTPAALLAWSARQGIALTTLDGVTLDDPGALLRVNAVRIAPHQASTVP